MISASNNDILRQQNRDFRKLKLKLFEVLVFKTYIVAMFCFVNTFISEPHKLGLYIYFLLLKTRIRIHKTLAKWIGALLNRSREMTLGVSSTANINYIH